MRKLHVIEDDAYMTPQPQEGLYVAAYFSDNTNRQLATYIEANKIPNPVAASSLHTTIVYSRVPVDGYEAAHTLNVEVNTSYARLEAWDTSGGTKCLVLCYFSPYLHIRFEEAIASGATYDFDEYKPHVTLSYDIGDFDWQSLPQLSFPLIIAGEYCETLDLGES
jgi:hypothetical protein